MHNTAYAHIINFVDIAFLHNMECGCGDRLRLYITPYCCAKLLVGMMRLICKEWVMLVWESPNLSFMARNKQTYNRDKSVTLGSSTNLVKNVHCKSGCASLSKSHGGERASNTRVVFVSSFLGIKNIVTPDINTRQWQR